MSKALNRISRVMEISNRAVTRRIDAVQPVVADRSIFPANRIMNGVCACVTPMAVQSMLDEGRARAGKLDELRCNEERRFGRSDLSLSDGDRRRGDRLDRRLRLGSVDEFSGAVEQRARRVNPDLQFASDRDRIGVVTCTVDA